MRILITWFSTGDGGGERSTIDLTNYLAESSLTSKVILLYAYSNLNNKVLLSSEFHKKVTLYTIRTSLPVWNFLSFFIVFYLCLKEKPDIVQVNFRAVFGESLAASLTGRKVVSCLRVILIDRNNMKSFRFVDHIIGVSRAVLERVRLLNWERGTTLIYNGVDLKEMNPNKLLDLAPDRNRIYFLSRLVRWKRPDWFVLAASEIHHRFPETKFAVFGEGLKRKEIEVLIKKERSKAYVNAAGWISPYNRELSQWGIFVLTSYEEPFGRAIVEAVLRGKVVVAPRSGAIPELLPNYDLLFDRDDFKDLIRKVKLAYLKFDQYRNQIVGIRKKFIESYNMERVKDEYILTYQRVLSN